MLEAAMAESLKQKVAFGHRQCEWASYSGKNVGKSIWEKMLFSFSLLNIWWCSLLTWHNALGLYFLLLIKYWQLNLLIVPEKSLCVISRCTEALCLKQGDCSSETAYLLNWHHLFLCRPSFDWGYFSTILFTCRDICLTITFKKGPKFMLESVCTLPKDTSFLLSAFPYSK